MNKNMRYKFLGLSLIVIGLSLSLQSCNKEDTLHKNDNEASVLRFTASTVNSVEATTRSWSDTYNSAFPDGTVIDLFLYDSDKRDLSAEQNNNTSRKWKYSTNGEVDIASGRSLLTQTFPTADDPETVLPKFPTALADDGYVDVFAVFFPTGCNVSVPGITNSEYSDIIPSRTSFTFSVQTDQSNPDNVVASDFLANDVTSAYRPVNGKGGSAINLEMKHRMAKVLVKFNPTEDLESYNMPINTYSIENVKTELTVKLMPSDFNITGDISTTGNPTSIKAKVDEPFFLPPQTITAGTKFLKFDLRNVGGTDTGIRNVTYAPTSDLTFNEGVYYVLTLNVGVHYITITTTIRDWTAETITFDKIIL
ncbi:MAG: fimbrillin family protein [Prevotella sp.]|nr:fimbrillin family protein [Prevotella sp.]